MYRLKSNNFHALKMHQIELRLTEIFIFLKEIKQEYTILTMKMANLYLIDIRKHFAILEYMFVTTFYE